MATVEVTYKCTAGHKRTIDMEQENVIEIIPNFVGFEREHPDDGFFPGCEKCKTASIGMRCCDDGVTRLVKMCTLTKVK